MTLLRVTTKAGTTLEILDQDACAAALREVFGGTILVKTFETQRKPEINSAGAPAVPIYLDELLFPASKSGKMLTRR